ncbi:MAG: DUF1990 domain-containing protein [Magnetococcales bacterium]|nr:DUF1990 domain-containing protein [Magnetococcales bacterium]
MALFRESETIFTLRKPDRPAVEAFLAAERRKPFTYPEVGATHPDQSYHLPELRQRYRVLHHRLRLGGGSDVFARARQAISAWRMFDLDWVRLCWPETPIVAGNIVAVLGEAMGVWSINGCRIVYVLDENDADRRRFGFAYGTTPRHAIVGEERMLVEWQRQDDSVWYDLHAFSRKSHLLAKVGAFHLHHLQQRFARESHLAMLRAVADH